ncbi:MAG: YceH family protein [Pirellulaceae bacterium]|nr:YceH family protein [Pirellulaceae bacterium]
MEQTPQFENSSGTQTSSDEPAPAWQPLSAIERRIVGVLIEKAKTTPDSYPLSLNALTTGCNQKSNRSPQMNLDTDDVEESMEDLRTKGAVGVIQGGGRVIKYRHYMKEWLAVSGVELAVVAELLLRGPQTIGELRGRAARMAPIADLSALRPVLASLEAKNLVVALTPEGRGQMVTHALYADSELERLKREHGGGGSVQIQNAPASPAAVASSSVPPAPTAPATPVATKPAETSNNATASSISSESSSDLSALRNEVRELSAEVTRLRKEVEDLWANLRS